jgi:hypothetical protein
VMMAGNEVMGIVINGPADDRHRAAIMQFKGRGIFCHVSF